MKFSRKVISHLKTIKLHTTVWIDALSNCYDKELMLSPKQESNSYYKLLEQLSTAPTEKFPVHPSFLKALNCSYRTPNVEEKVYETVLTLLQHYKLLLH